MPTKLTKIIASGLIGLSAVCFTAGIREGILAIREYEQTIEKKDIPAIGEYSRNFPTNSQNSSYF